MKKNSFSIVPTVSEKNNKSRKVVKFDFTEVDEIRNLVKETVTKISKPVKRRGKNPSYDKSTFYIGRNVANLSFHTLYVSEFQVRLVVKALKEQFTHDIYQVGRTLHIYMRGKRRR